MRVLLLTIALSAISCARQGHESPKTEQGTKPFAELTIDQVEQKLAGTPKPVVLDANPREVYEKRHLPGAIWVPEDGSVASVVPKDKSASLIFYCANPH
ncbi:MAG: rhodanese-like domain-containing protein [Polyangiales bacterium]